MFVIYGKDGCSFCEKAVELAKQQFWKFEYKNISVDTRHASELIARAPNARTVPQIFYGDHHIGGYTELKEAFNTGALTDIINEEK